jgi:hypothetical protein
MCCTAAGQVAICIAMLKIRQAVRGSKIKIITVMKMKLISS